MAAVLLLLCSVIIMFFASANGQICVMSPDVEVVKVPVNKPVTLTCTLELDDSLLNDNAITLGYRLNGNAFAVPGLTNLDTVGEGRLFKSVEKNIAVKVNGNRGTPKQSTTKVLELTILGVNTDGYQNFTLSFGVRLNKSGETSFNFTSKVKVFVVDEDPETTSPSTTLSTTEPASTEKVTTTESSEFIAAQKEIEEARQHNMVLKYALVAVGGVSAVLLIAICVIGIVVYKTRRTQKSSSKHDREKV